MFEIINYVNDSVVHHSLVLIQGKFFNCELPITVSICNVNDNNSRYFCKVNSNLVILLCHLVKGKNELKIFDDKDKNLASLTISYAINENRETLKLLYIVCQDLKKISTAEKMTFKDNKSSIEFTAELLQSLYAESLRGYCKESSSFCLDYPSQCVLFQSKLSTNEALQLNARDLWLHFAKEISISYNSRAMKFLAFLSFTRYDVPDMAPTPNTFEDMLKFTKGYASLGNGGLALIGTPCLSIWPKNLTEFEKRVNDETVIDRRTFLDHGRSGTYAGCYAMGLGTVCHELGHIFDLVHTPEGIMGNSYCNVINALYIKGNSSNATSIFNQSLSKTKEIKQHRNVSFSKYWCQSSLHVLKYHRWFNHNKSSLHGTIELAGSKIRSMHSIVIVEVRKKDQVVNFWHLKEERQIKEFKIPILCHKNLEQLHIFAMDVYGNILKMKLT